MEFEEMFPYIIQGRLAGFYEERGREKLQEMKEKLEEWEQLMCAVEPELTEKHKELLEWFQNRQGEELENCYVFGLRDGVKLMTSVFGNQQN